MNRKWVKRLMIIGGLLALVVVAVVGHGFRKCVDVKINVRYDSASVFVTPAEVRSYLVQTVGEPIGQRLNQINIQSIENLLQINPFISEAQANIDLSGVLNIEIKQKKPIVRVQNKKGQHFYISEEGLMMPISQHGIERTPFASGEIFENYSSIRSLRSEDSPVADSLLKRSVLFRLWYLSLKIKNDPFMVAQTDQIYVNENSEFEIVPRVGGQLIVIGNINDLEKKFVKLKALYSESFSQVGWNKYAIINLKFKNQVVCTKK